ncbi:Coenzyme Q-binding protein coq10, mitochondrial [Ciborinia camelliae]|nr:Coenzyme Q-binding protein coq10, mitochondrial [Ciborinia camelliae]
MSTPIRGMLRTLRPTSALRSFTPSAQRTFITLPGSEPQILTEKRILPYKSSSLYSLIADVDSYSSFVPYCTSSHVTQWSTPDLNGNKWPAEANLTVGWAGVEETFTSKLLCVPGSIVEALGGDAVTSIPESKLPHHSETYHRAAAANGIFQSLNTRWSLKPFRDQSPTGQPQTDKPEHGAREQTEVHLTIEFQFANPLYTALSKAVAPQIAPKMIEAFELRARKLLDRPGAGR